MLIFVVQPKPGSEPHTICQPVCRVDIFPELYRGMKKAAATRLNILQKSFALIYAKGYHNASLDDILATTEVTKGAFYYHFKNKDEMGLAIINELMKPALTERFAAGLRNADDPLDAIYRLLHHLLLDDDFLQVAYGCPAANFTHEMTPWNAGFTDALNAITQEWTDSIAAAIDVGKTNSAVRSDVDAQQVAVFVMSGYWGVRNLGKLTGGEETYQNYLAALRFYLAGLK